MEYRIKRFDIKEQRKLLAEIDLYGRRFFTPECSRFLLNPSDELLFEYFPEFEFFPEMQEERIQVAISKYKAINELCIRNNTCPLFDDPEAVAECEKTRLELVRIVPEEILNAYFGVTSIREYEPPIYRAENG